MSQIELTLFIQALQSGAVRLALRPVVTAADQDVVAFDALLRSEHAGLDTPDKVVRAAETFEMVPELAEEVARRAAAWLDRLTERVALVIDLHPAELYDPEAVLGRLAPLGRHGPRLVLRIPHPGLLLDVPRCEDTVRALKDAGHRLAMGHVATGFRVLPFATRVMPDIFCLEPVFVAGIAMDPSRRPLLERVVSFATKHQAQVLADGVASGADAGLLQGVGVHLLSGPLLGEAWEGEE